MLQENFVVAKQEIEALLSSNEVKPSSSQASILSADLARCLAQLKLTDSSMQLADKILVRDLNAHDAGDRILIYASLKEAYSLSGRLRGDESLSQSFSAALSDHRAQTAVIEKLLVEFQSNSHLE